MVKKNKGVRPGITPRGVMHLRPVTPSLLSDPRDGRDTLSVRCSAAASRGFYGRRSLTSALAFCQTEAKWISP